MSNVVARQLGIGERRISISTVDSHATNIFDSSRSLNTDPEIEQSSSSQTSKDTSEEKKEGYISPKHAKKLRLTKTLIVDDSDESEKVSNKSADK